MNRAITRCIWVVAVVVLVAVGAPAEAATTIDCDPAPFVVTQSIKVANDVTNCPTDGLVIAADNITIDLNGHTIDGNELSDLLDGEDGIDNQAGHTGVVIKNGVLQEFERGAFLSGGRNSLVNVVVIGNTIDGVNVSGARNVIRSNTISGNSQDGIESSTTRSTIKKNVISGNGEQGIDLFGDFNSLIGNTTSENASHGIIFFQGSDDNVVLRNTVSGNSGDGLRIDNGDRNTFEENVVSGNDGEAFDVSQTVGSVFAANRVDGNDAGIIVTGDNLVIRGNNTSGSDSWAGIEVNGQDNRVVGNVSRANADSGIIVTVPSGVATVRENRSSGNGEDGIIATGQVATFRDNVTKGNGFATPGPGDQDGLGIDASGLSTANGGGNVASGNDNPSECLPTPLCS